MEIIQAPNKFVSNDDTDKLFVYLGGSIKAELIDYIKDKITGYEVKPNKVVIFNSIYDLSNKSEEEKKEYFTWENDQSKKSDIFIILFDDSEKEKNFYQLGKNVLYFSEIYKNNLDQHFLVAYTDQFKNEFYLKTQLNLTVQNLISPSKINDTPSFGDLILKKIESFYKATDLYIDHNVIHTEQEHYWSTNLGPNITKLFCQAPWPQSKFMIGILGTYGIGKTAIYNWFKQGRYIKWYEHMMGGASAQYEVEINNKKFIVTFEDTASQERFGAEMIVNRYLKNKNCVILVFDITNRNSFNDIKNKVYPEIKNSEYKIDFLILIGSKLDLKNERNILYEEADMFAEENDMKYFEVSAKSGENMERVCNYVYYRLSKY